MSYKIENTYYFSQKFSIFCNFKEGLFHETKFFIFNLYKIIMVKGNNSELNRKINFMIKSNRNPEFLIFF